MACAPIFMRSCSLKSEEVERHCVRIWEGGKDVGVVMVTSCEVALPPDAEKSNDV